MKKLSKLEINLNKIMKNEELITLRGGYDPCTCTCQLTIEPYCCFGYLVSETGNCPADCNEVFGPFATVQCGNIYPCDSCN